MLRLRSLPPIALLSVILVPGAASASEIIINELHYDPEKDHAAEFIELYNRGNVPVDLEGWRLTDGVGFTFPTTTMAPGAYLVIAEDPATVQAEFGVTALGPWSGKLSNDGERVVLEDSSGNRVDQVDYGLAFPWPTAPRGEGSSMELIHPSLDNDLGGSWRSSATGGFRGPALTFLAPGDPAWRYRTGESWPTMDGAGRQWFEDGYDENPDGHWLTGQTPIGHGDNDDATVISGMRNNYRSLFLRREFEISAETQIPSSLLLSAYYDDGCVVYLNGREVARFSLPDGEIPFPLPDRYPESHEAAWEDVILEGAADFLHVGTNTLAVQVINRTIGSSDLSIDLKLETPPPSEVSFGPPTPAAVNSVFSTLAPPQIRQVKHLPKSPTSGQEVILTAKVTDPDEVALVQLEYQLVEPGHYIRLTDAAYQTDWTPVAMRDDGLGGDLIAGDSTYTVTLPASMQIHRRLTRYRIAASDEAGASVTVPYRDDPSANFAFFTYDGAPAWTGAVRPGQTPAVTYSPAVMNSLPIYHLISNASDVTNSQYNATYNDKVYRWEGALVYGNEVYDHIHYRIRGSASTYNTGKNKWKIRFNRGHRFQGHDDYGRPFKEKVRTLNWSALASPWNPANRGMAGLDEALAFRLWEKAGAVTRNSNYFHLRIIDGITEQNPSNQFDGDNWGLYLTIDQVDRRFLDERGLPDGNTFNMHFGASNIINEAAGQPHDRSDLFAFIGTGANGYNRLPVQPVTWWEENVELANYFNYRAVVEAINHSDLRDRENSNLYHNPVTGKWTMIPWDVDLLYEEFDRWGPDAVQSQAPLEQFRKCLTHPELNLRFQNRARELQDLLLNDDQGWTLVDEVASHIADIDGDLGWPEVDAARWNADPRSRKVEGTGGTLGMLFFMNPYQSTRFPAHRRTLSSADFPGMVDWVKNFIVPSGFGGGRLAAMVADPEVPATPTITYSGLANMPTRGLSFECSEFVPGAGGSPFAAMEWRIGEIDNSTTPHHLAGEPWRYEIDSFWSSGELPDFSNSLVIPAIAVREDHTYRARVRHKGTNGHWSHWSDPVQFTATAPDLTAYLEGLVISEIMYKPIGGGNLEFVELKNVGTVPLDLSEVRFTKGIDFDFAHSAITTLAPGAYVLVVQNLAAFETEYGKGFPVAGEFGPDHLSNGGERLKLSFGAGSAIRDIRYGDNLPWPTSPDDAGYSLVLIHPDSLPDHAGPASWRSSTLPGGNPGSSDAAPPFRGDPEADSDRDGFAALLEHALGGSDTIAGDVALPSMSFQTRDLDEGPETFLIIELTHDLAAEDVALTLEVSRDLSRWESGEALLVPMSEVAHGDGTLTLTYRSTEALGRKEHRFIRVHAKLRP